MPPLLHFQAKASGKQLFEQVTRTIGVREVWYFGLQCTDNKGHTSWLRFDKKVREQIRKVFRLLNPPNHWVCEVYF